MALVLNTNVMSLIAQRKLSISTSQVERSMEKLASGSRINRAADDAAGLTISQNLRSQITRMKQALRNTQDGISILQVAEGATSTIINNLQRVRELTIQAANDTNSPQSRNAAEEEIKALLQDIDRIAAGTEFNNTPLLDGSVTYAPIQIGPNSDYQTNVINLGPLEPDGVTIIANAPLRSMYTGDPANPAPPPGYPQGLGLFDGGLGGTTFADIGSVDFSAVPPLGSNDIAQGFLSDVDAALDYTLQARAAMGSIQNQLETVIENLQSSIENFSASDSRIRDLDIASEAATLTQYQVLQNAAVGVLSQANRLPQMILGLLDARG